MSIRRIAVNVARQGAIINCLLMLWKMCGGAGAGLGYKVGSLFAFNPLRPMVRETDGPTCNGR